VSVYQLRLSEPLTHPERAIHISAKSRETKNAVSLPGVFVFFKKRLISSRSLRESVFFVYISLCSKRVTLARINCPHVSLSMDGQCVWWISGGARAETLHCARGEFSPLKMRTELEPHLWLTLTVSCLPCLFPWFCPGFRLSTEREDGNTVGRALHNWKFLPFCYKLLP